MPFSLAFTFGEPVGTLCVILLGIIGLAVATVLFRSRRKASFTIQSKECRAGDCEGREYTSALQSATGALKRRSKAPRPQNATAEPHQTHTHSEWGENQSLQQPSQLRQVQDVQQETKVQKQHKKKKQQRRARLEKAVHDKTTAPEVTSSYEGSNECYQEQTMCEGPEFATQSAEDEEPKEAVTVKGQVAHDSEQEEGEGEQREAEEEEEGEEGLNTQQPETSRDAKLRAAREVAALRASVAESQTDDDGFQLVSVSRKSITGTSSVDEKVSFAPHPPKANDEHRRRKESDNHGTPLIERSPRPSQPQKQTAKQQPTQPQTQQPSQLPPLEREILKWEKKAREVQKLRVLHEGGSTLDPLQLEKLTRGDAIMDKLQELRNNREKEHDTLRQEAERRVAAEEEAAKVEAENQMRRSVAVLNSRKQPFQLLVRPQRHEQPVVSPSVAAEGSAEGAMPVLARPASSPDAAHNVDCPVLHCPRSTEQSNSPSRSPPSGTCGTSAAADGIRPPGAPGTPFVPRILLRPQGAERPVDAALRVLEQPVKPLEQKEAEYAAARARFFGDQPPPSGKHTAGAGRGRNNGTAAGSARRGNASSAALAHVQREFDPDYDRSGWVVSPTPVGASDSDSDSDYAPGMYY